MFSFWTGETQASGQPQNPAYGQQQPPPYGTGAPIAVHKETRNKLLNVALAIGSFGLLLAVIGVSICQWFVLKLGSIGLFADCFDCPGWLLGTRAMVVMGIMLTGVGVILLVVNRIPIVAGLACLVGGFFLLIGAIIFGAKKDNFERKRDDFGLDRLGSNILETESVKISSGASHYLVIFAAILELVAGGLVLANAMKKKK